ncbi:hypothetical protein K9M79_00205 [Candidatus Woesearchaeota archaeon]|nr:hypothetical protein [Candidatus Woesearchaeota archaeon]
MKKRVILIFLTLFLVIPLFYSYDSIDDHSLGYIDDDSNSGVDQNDNSPTKEYDMGGAPINAFLDQRIRNINLNNFNDLEKMYEDIHKLSELFYSASGLFYMYGEEKAALMYLNITKKIYQSTGKENIVTLLDFYERSIRSGKYNQVYKFDKTLFTINPDFRDAVITYAKKGDPLIIDNLVVEIHNSTSATIQIDKRPGISGLLIPSDHIPKVQTPQTIFITQQPEISGLLRYFYGNYSIVPLHSAYHQTPVFESTDQNMKIDLLFDSPEVTINNFEIIKNPKLLVEDLEFYAYEPNEVLFLSSPQIPTNYNSIDLPAKIVGRKMISIQFKTKNKGLEEVQSTILYFAIVASLFFFILFNYLGVTFTRHHYHKSYFLLVVSVILPFYLFFALKWLFDLVDYDTIDTRYTIFCSIIIAVTMIASSFGYFLGTKVLKLDHLKHQRKILKEELNKLKLKQIDEIVKFIGFESNQKLDKAKKIEEIIKLKERELKETIAFIEEDIIDYKINFHKK